jgi:PKD repeat protein
MRKLLVYAAALPLAAMAACTVHDVDVPSLSGPSSLAISLSVTATPDTLPQDGAATSRIVVKAFNAGGQPYPNLSVRLDMRINGSVQDFGTLSARTILTAADGTASAIYTAPAGPSVGGLGSTVTVIATPIASDAANDGILNTVGALSQAVLHLTPSGNVVPPPTETPTPAFVATPAGPTAGQIVLFNGTGSCPSTATSGVCNAANSTLTSWDWDFGDGTAHGSGSIVTHQYTVARPYAVILTVTNSQGGQKSLVTVITVGAGVGPAALFTVLPSPAELNGTVTLDGSPSTGAPINYRWAISSPAPVTTTNTGSSNPVATFSPNVVGTWTITLTVTDAQGRTNTSAVQNLIVQ